MTNLSVQVDILYNQKLEWWVSGGVCLLTKLKVINFLPKRSPNFSHLRPNFNNGLGILGILKICQFFYRCSSLLLVSCNSISDHQISSARWCWNVLPKWYGKKIYYLICNLYVPFNSQKSYFNFHLFHVRVVHTLISGAKK